MCSPFKSCQQDGRVILTSGAPFNTVCMKHVICLCVLSALCDKCLILYYIFFYWQLKGMVPEGMCVHVTPGKARDQALEVFDHLNIQVTPSDIFSRCQVIAMYD